MGGVFSGVIKVMVHDTEEVKRIIEGLKKNPSIKSVSRI